MNYIKQLNAFWKWRELHEISHAEADLYFALLCIFNEFFWQDNLPIPSRTPIGKAELSDKSQLRKLRMGLIDKGLIQYNEGKKGKSGTYSIVQLYDENTPIMTPIVQENDTVLTDKLQENNPYVDPYFDTIYKTNTKTNTKTETKTVISTMQKSEAAEYIRDLYNSICNSLPRLIKLTDSRENAVMERLKIYSVEQIEDAFKKAEASDFLKGAGRNWKANFDWFFKNDENILKVIEGNYDNGTYPNKYNSSDPYLNTTTEDVHEIEQQFMNVYCED